MTTLPETTAIFKNTQEVKVDQTTECPVNVDQIAKDFAQKLELDAVGTRYNWDQNMCYLTFTTKGTPKKYFVELAFNMNGTFDWKIKVVKSLESRDQVEYKSCFDFDSAVRNVDMDLTAMISKECKIESIVETTDDVKIIKQETTLPEIKDFPQVSQAPYYMSKVLELVQLVSQPNTPQKSADLAAFVLPYLSTMFSKQVVDDVTPIVKILCNVGCGFTTNTSEKQLCNAFIDSSSSEKILRYFLFGGETETAATVKDDGALEWSRQLLFAVALTGLLKSDDGWLEMEKFLNKNESDLSETGKRHMAVAKTLMKSCFTAMVNLVKKTTNGQESCAFVPETKCVADTKPVVENKRVGDTKPVVETKVSAAFMENVPKNGVEDTYFKKLVSLAKDFKAGESVVCVCPKNLSCESTQTIGTLIKTQLMKKNEQMLRPSPTCANFTKTSESFKNDGSFDLVVVNYDSCAEDPYVGELIFNGRHNGYSVLMFTTKPILRKYLRVVDHVVEIMEGSNGTINIEYNPHRMKKVIENQRLDLASVKEMLEINQNIVFNNCQFFVSENTTKDKTKQTVASKQTFAPKQAFTTESGPTPKQNVASKQSTVPKTESKRFEQETKNCNKSSTCGLPTGPKKCCEKGCIYDLIVIDSRSDAERQFSKYQGFVACTKLGQSMYRVKFDTIENAILAEEKFNKSSVKDTIDDCCNNLVKLMEQYPPYKPVLLGLNDKDIPPTEKEFNVLKEKLAERGIFLQKFSDCIGLMKK